MEFLGTGDLCLGFIGYKIILSFNLPSKLNRASAYLVFLHRLYGAADNKNKRAEAVPPIVRSISFCDLWLQIWLQISPQLKVAT